jgi:hypothetical protein
LLFSPERAVQTPGRRHFWNISEVRDKYGFNENIKERENKH